MIDAVNENELLKPGDLVFKADFWLAIETGELSKTIAWKLREEDNKKVVIQKAIQQLFQYVNRLRTPTGEKDYKPNRKDIESFSKKFEKFYNEFHYLENVSTFLSKFDFDKEDEHKFDTLNTYLWHAFFRVTDNNVESTFKQWMVNEKRLLSGKRVHYPILFGLWSPMGGNGKSFLLECLAKALSDGHLFTLNQWSDLESTSGSYLKDVFGVLYKDEIGTTKGIKDTIKSLITTSEITIQCKYKEPLKLPKRFQLVCSANKPIGARLFEDESGYQRRDGTHECYGRLFDVESKDDLIRYFRTMFECCPIDYKMTSMTSKLFEYDEETIDLLFKLSQSDMMLNKKTGNASKAVKTKSLSEICNDIIGISKENEPRQYYKLEALLEKSGCFERIKYSNVSTRYFRIKPNEAAQVLEDVHLYHKTPWVYREYQKPTVKKNYDQMIQEAYQYKVDDAKDYGKSLVTTSMIDRVSNIVQDMTVYKQMRKEGRENDKQEDEQEEIDSMLMNL